MYLYIRYRMIERGHEMRMIAAMALCLMIAGCYAPRAEFSRFDGRLVDDVTRERVKTECEAKAKITMSQVPHKVFGDGYGIQRAIEQDQVRLAAVAACAAEHGMRVKWLEGKPACGSLPARAGAECQ